MKPPEQLPAEQPESAEAAAARTLSELLSEGSQGGRPRKTLEDVPVLTLVERLAGVLPANRIGPVLGIGASTFYRMLHEDAELREAYERGAARMEAALGLGIIRKAMDEGSLGAMTWMLEKRFGWGSEVGEGPPIPAQPQNGKAAELGNPNSRREDAG